MFFSERECDFGVIMTLSYKEKFMALNKMCFGFLYDNVFTLSAVGSGDAGCAGKATDLKNLTKALIS